MVRTLVRGSVVSQGLDLSLDRAMGPIQDRRGETD